MVIAPVDQRDADRSTREAVDGFQSAKSGADHDDTMAVRRRNVVSSARNIPFHHVSPEKGSSVGGKFPGKASRLLGVTRHDPTDSRENFTQQDNAPADAQLVCIEQRNAAATGGKHYLVIAA